MGMTESNFEQDEYSPTAQYDNLLLHLLRWRKPNDLYLSNPLKWFCWYSVMFFVLHCLVYYIQHTSIYVYDCVYIYIFMLQDEELYQMNLESLQPLPSQGLGYSSLRPFARSMGPAWLLLRGDFEGFELWWDVCVAANSIKMGVRFLCQILPSYLPNSKEATAPYQKQPINKCL